MKHREMKKIPAFWINRARVFRIDPGNVFRYDLVRLVDGIIRLDGLGIGSFECHEIDGNDRSRDSLSHYETGC